MPKSSHRQPIFWLQFSSMMRFIQLLVFCCLFTVMGSVMVRSQTARRAAPTVGTAPTRDSGSEEGIQKRWNELGIWGGISFQTPTLISRTPDARSGYIAIRYGRVLATSKTVAFEWTIDAVPLSILSLQRISLVPTGPGTFVLRKSRENVYGGGLSPIGLKLNFNRQHRVQPFGSGTGGYLYFRKDVPRPGAARFNFTFDLGGGIQLVNSSRHAFTIGYEFKHISNGGRSPINPGVDMQIVYVGFSIFR